MKSAQAILLDIPPHGKSLAQMWTWKGCFQSCPYLREAISMKPDFVDSVSSLQTCLENQVWKNPEKHQGSDIPKSSLSISNIFQSRSFDHLYVPPTHSAPRRWVVTLRGPPGFVKRGTGGGNEGVEQNCRILHNWTNIKRLETLLQNMAPPPKEQHHMSHTPFPFQLSFQTHQKKGRWASNSGFWALASQPIACPKGDSM